jgi:hypothetical protein
MPVRQLGAAARAIRIDMRKVPRLRSERGGIIGSPQLVHRRDVRPRDTNGRPWRGAGYRADPTEKFHDACAKVRA